MAAGSFYNPLFHPAGRAPTRQPLYGSSSTQSLTLPDEIYALVPYPPQAVNPFLTCQGITGEPLVTVACGALRITGKTRLISFGVEGEFNPAFKPNNNLILFQRYAIVFFYSRYLPNSIGADPILEKFPADQKHLEQILDYLPDGIICHDRERRIICFNRAAEALRRGPQRNCR